MSKGKDFYWTTTKEEFIERLKVLKTPYHLSVWNYLQAYIIRGTGLGETWTACYNVFKGSKLLAANISINRMSNDLDIGNKKIINILKDLDQSNYIIKYTSKSEKTHNTNIYVLGFLNINIDTESNIFRSELYLTNALTKMTPEDREKIISLYHRQLGVETEINCITSELREIQYRLFGINQVEPYEAVKQDNEGSVCRTQGEVVSDGHKGSV